MHHTVRNFDTQRQIFSNITCANAVLDDPSTAAYEIDRVFAAIKTYRQPVYIELPRDMVDKAVGYDLDQGTPKVPVSDPINLAEALEEVEDWIASAENPVILAGVELSRFGLGESLIKWAEKTNIPMFTEILSKSTVGERHPLFGGVYSRNAAPQSVRDKVEQSDCILMLGVMLTDMVLGGTQAKFTHRQTIRANVGELKISNHNYKDVVFSEFCESLFRTELAKKPLPAICKKLVPKSFVAEINAKLTTRRFFEKIDSIITKKNVIITDVGDSLFGAVDLTVAHADSFISPAYYASMGMAIPAALGVRLGET